jgi:hypothetical protein
MATMKTVQSDASVEAFLAGIDDPVRRQDAIDVCAMLTRLSKCPPRMWGSAIVGFGVRRLVYDSGREIDWMIIGFSPRKQHTVLYLMDGYAGHGDLLARLGKYKIGRSCLYLGKLADVDQAVLAEMLKKSIAAVNKASVRN